MEHTNSAHLWEIPKNSPEKLRLAKGYPYKVPKASYLFRSGKVSDIGEASFRGRMPILAHGSNRAPEQLARKFSDGANEVEIPVTYGWLEDHDVVYSAHVTRYGAIASTLRRVEGCRVRVAVTWLTEPQLARMHVTEGANYPFGRIESVALGLEAGPAEKLDTVFAYHSRHGCLSRAGAPIGLAALEAEGRRHPALPQEAVLALVRDRHHPEDDDLDSHILKNVDDAKRRASLIEKLARDALPNPLMGFHDRPAG